MQGWVNFTKKISIRNYYKIENFLIRKWINNNNKYYYYYNNNYINNVQKRNISTTKSIIDINEQKYNQDENDSNNNNKNVEKKYLKKKFLISIEPELSEISKSQFVSGGDLDFNNKNSLYNDVVRLRKVLPRDALNVIKLFQESFTKCDPIATCLDIPDKPLFCPILKEFWINSIRQGMTYAAIPSNSVSTEYLYGAVLNTRLTQFEPDHWWLYSKCSNCPKTKNLLNLWSHIVKDSAIHHISRSKKILNIAHVIINEDESKKLNPKFNHVNLSKILILKSFRIASSKGYRTVSFMCTNDIMCKVARFLNMELIYEKPYKDLFESAKVKKAYVPDYSLKIFTKKI